MPSHKKRLVRARMERTGEAYQQALRHVRAATKQPEHVARRGSAHAQAVADTAYSIAAVRAEEAARPPEARLFHDPLAKIFASSGEHVRESTDRFLALPFFRDGVRLRTRFIDDVVADSLGEGLRQLVLVGAGFDARGHRMVSAASGVRVFELDTPEQLTRKRALLRRAGVPLPRHVRHVAMDFEQVDLERDAGPRLHAEGFRRGDGAVFVWEGVIGYVDLATIDRSLRFMAREGGAGSVLVFTYYDAVFDPDTVEAHTRSAGWEQLDVHDGDAMWRRYLAGEPDPAAAYMKVGVARRRRG